MHLCSYEGYNQLSGLLPTEFGLLTNLQSMYLCKCIINTSFGFGHGWNQLLKQIYQYDLFAASLLFHEANNELTGTIPTEYGLLTNLQYIGLCKCIIII